MNILDKISSVVEVLAYLAATGFVVFWLTAKGMELLKIASRGAICFTENIALYFLYATVFFVILMFICNYLR